MLLKVRPKRLGLSRPVPAHLPGPNLVSPDQLGQVSDDGAACDLRDVDEENLTIMKSFKAVPTPRSLGQWI